MSSLIKQPRAKKALGQHFLHDARMARRIADQLDITPDDVVVEVGPGAGALTRHLLEAGPRRLLCLEKDRTLAPQLKKAHPELDMILMDALTAPWQRIAKAHPGVKIAGNLPYNVASPIMWDCVSQAEDCARAAFMVQKEVAKRICAAPGGKAYGALTVWLQAHARVEYAFTVGPGAFSPPPKVDSGVVTFFPYPATSRTFNGDWLGAVVKRCFQQRRKQLGTIIRDYLDERAREVLAAEGIFLTARPETLTIKNFLTLAKCLGSRILP